MDFFIVHKLNFISDFITVTRIFSTVLDTNNGKGNSHDFSGKVAYVLFFFCLFVLPLSRYSGSFFEVVLCQVQYVLFCF